MKHLTHHEYVVPKSIPMTVPISFLSSLAETLMIAKADKANIALNNLIPEGRKEEIKKKKISG